MDALLLIIVGLATAAFVAAPLLTQARSSNQEALETEVWHTMPQLEIDRSLGKIDDEEYQELKQHLRPEPTVSPVEALIFNFRRARRLNASLEAEVLIARARRKRKI